MKLFLIAAQIAVAVSVLNVWLLRREMASPWRGASARTLREEFAAYGLPSWSLSVVGAAKVTCALLLLAGLFIPTLVRPAAVGMALFMAGAILNHVRVADPIRKSLPAGALLALAVMAAVLAGDSSIS